ncbi:Thiamine-monophosphate kinase [Acaryochloris thomasi RCC1774]|uniref:Thiamine-monophosphate kinase n=1 Tax=Acaryochloris thomasi RCC1774 TaxID=1764569 RepID=A0A2W1JYU1_9CYAN|nr:thiamine-phosphate kinase [Acaryochloris thomasi]PZD74634.1 Thiamine-monophosphate kinase [Acaryochloris thomasi RCC1774]
MSETVAELGEQAILQRLQPYCSRDKLGDDAAVLEPQPGFLLVISTDMLVDGVHFSDRTTSPFDIGWRTAAANLSDLAAMGATPLGLTVSLGLPPALLVAQLEQIYQGIRDCLQHYGTTIIGGDICRSDCLTLSMTALGQVSPQQQIRRTTAQLGDAILVTGAHGGSRAGLEILLKPEWGQSLSEAERTALCRIHQRPQPRLDVSPLLRQHYPELCVTGMDSSDGLADAILQICRASGVGAILDRIPIPTCLQTIAPEQALDWALYGGEDFELVLCLPANAAEAMVNSLGDSAQIIGQIVRGSDVQFVDPRGIEAPRTLSLSQGFQHFETSTTDESP